MLRKTVHSRQNGYSLVELMLTITLGMIVVGGALAIYMSTFSANSSALKTARLNNELRSTMTFIARDIRRSGHWDGAENAAMTGALISNQFTTTYPINLVSASCILLSYDTNGDGAYNSPNEAYGFRYDATQKAVEVRQAAGDCAATGWVNLTDPDVVEITAFSITENSPGAVTSATSTIQSRSYTVRIEGQLKKDTAVKRALRETIRVRNEILS